MWSTSTTLLCVFIACNAALFAGWEAGPLRELPFLLVARA